MAELEQSTSVAEQPEKDSSTKTDDKDQVTKTDSGESKVTPTEYEVDGEKVTAEQLREWKQGYMRTQDYTKKTQEIAEAKRELSRAKESDAKITEIDPDVKAAIETLKQAGMATKEDLLLMKVQDADQKEFRKLIKTHPELKAHEKALKVIGERDNRAWVDIAKDYGFLKDAKLEKAKESKPIVGVKVSPTDSPKEKGVKDMTAKEYEVWKKKNLGKGKWA